MIVKLKYKYKIIDIYKNDRWFTPLFLNFSYNRFKKRIMFSYHRRLKSCYYSKFRFSYYLNRKLPSLIKLVQKPNERPKIWKRYFRERLMYNSRIRSFGKKDKLIKKRNIQFDPYKMDLSRIPIKYLQYIYFLNNTAYRSIIDQLDFDFSTYKYKKKKFKFINNNKENVLSSKISYRETLYNKMYNYYASFLELPNILQNIEIINKYKLFGNFKKKKFNLKLPNNLTYKKQDTLLFKLKKKFDFNFSFKKKRIKNKKFYGSDYGLKLSMIRKLRLFYGFLPYNQLRKIYKRSLKKNNRGDLGYFIILLESKIDILLFRSALFSSVFECQRCLRAGKIFINNQSIFFPDYFLKDFDFISFEKNLKTNLKRKILIDIVKRSIIRFKANHLEIDYKIFKLIFLLENLKLDNFFLDNNLAIIKTLNWQYVKMKKNFNKKKKNYLFNFKSRYVFPYNKHATLLKEFFAERMSF